MRKVIKKAGVFALIATLVLTGIALPVKEKAVAETKDYGISNPRVEFLERECVFFGNYWQKDTNNDGVADQKDDKTPIKWQVLDKVNGEVILLSEQILDIQDYDNENTSVAWENCSLRKWLNNDFINEAFSEYERTQIILNENKDNEQKSDDKITLLSVNDLSDTSYGFNEETSYKDQARTAEYTDYSRHYDYKTYGDCYWHKDAGCVLISGSVARSWTGKAGIRPVLKLSNNEYKKLQTSSNQNIAIKKTIWDTVTFGKYNQEPICWRVLQVDGDNAFLLADSVLEKKQFNKVDEIITWEKCTLRKWLNEDFLESSFDAKEKNAIIKSNDENSAEKENEDYIFILSETEVLNEKFGFASSYLCATNTRYANYTDDGEYAGSWWIRSINRNDNTPYEIISNGCVSSGSCVDQIGGVRPALHINLSALSSLKKVGTVSAGEDGIKYYDLEGKQINGTVPTVKPDVTATPKTTVTVEPTKVPDVTPTTVQTKVPTVTRTVEPVSITKPNAVTGFKAKSFKGKLKLSWNKVSGASGYVINYSLKSNFKKAKKVTITKASTKAKTLKGLKKKKKYFVRIRAYKKSGSKKIYGKWKKISKKTK